MKRFLAVLGAIAVVPFFLPRRSRVVRTIWIDAHPAEVFPLVNNLRNWPLWTAWGRQFASEFSYEGPESGEGATQHWTNTRGSGTVRIVGSLEDERVSYEVEMGENWGILEGVFKLEPLGKGTQVTWACWWHSGANPYFRYIDLALRLWIGRDFALGLKHLSELVSESQKEMVWIRGR